MTSDSYERVTFGQGPLDSDVLNRLSSNQDHLYERMVTGYYDMLGVTRETGLTFRVGHAKLVNQSDWYQYHNIYFNRPFLPGTRPAVFLTMSSDQHWYIFHAVQGLDGRAIPDHRGFKMIVGKMHDWAYELYDREQYISYLAIAPSG